MARQISKREIAQRYDVSVRDVDREGGKQLFWVWKEKDGREYGLVLSYSTVVGVVENGVAYLTDRRHTPTTSRHVNYVKRQGYSSVVVSEDELAKRVEQWQC